MIERIDHIAIAVRDYNKAAAFFQEIFGAVPGVGAEDEKLVFYWKNFALGDLSRLEILTPTGENSFLKNFLKNREGGVHHITLQTPDINRAKQFLKSKNIPFFGYYEYPDGLWRELYIHPRDAFGILIQIAQFRADDWIADSAKFPPGKRWDIEKTSGGATISFAHSGGGKMKIDLNKREIRKLIDDLSGLL